MNMADFTVKDINNVDVPFVAITGAAGDGSQAVWRVTDVSKPPLYQTTLKMKAVPTADKKARRSILEGVAYFGSVVDGVWTPSARVPLSVEVVTPLNMSAVDAANYATVLMRTCAAALITGSVGSGYAPNN